MAMLIVNAIHMSSPMPMWWANENTNQERCTIKLATSEQPDGPEGPQPFSECQKGKYNQAIIIASLLIALQTVDFTEFTYHKTHRYV